MKPAVKYKPTLHWGGRIRHRCSLPLAAIVLGLSFVMTSENVLADKQYSTSIISESGSPITLIKCEAWARDINKTILYSHASIANMLSDIGISFTNNADKPVIGLRLEVASYDIANAVVGFPQHLGTDANRSADGMSGCTGRDVRSAWSSQLASGIQHTREC